MYGPHDINLTFIKNVSCNSKQDPWLKKKNILLGKEHFNLKTCILTEIKNDFMLKNNFF